MLAGTSSGRRVSGADNRERACGAARRECVDFPRDFRGRTASSPRGQALVGRFRRRRAVQHHGDGARVLRNMVHRRVELRRRPPGPARIGQHGAAQRDQVRLPIRHDCLRHRRIGDEPDGPRRHTGLAADAFGEGDLIAGRERNLLARGGYRRSTRRRRRCRSRRAHGRRRPRRRCRIRPAPIRSPTCARRPARVRAARRARRARPAAESACGFPASRRSGRCAGWRRARGTRAAGSRGRNASRRSRSRRGPRDARRRRRLRSSRRFRASSSACGTCQSSA